MSQSPLPRQQVNGVDQRVHLGTAPGWVSRFFRGTTTNTVLFFLLSNTLSPVLRPMEILVLLPKSLCRAHLDDGCVLPVITY